jgi:hypothetical protein
VRERVLVLLDAVLRAAGLRAPADFARAVAGFARVDVERAAPALLARVPVDDFLAEDFLTPAALRVPAERFAELLRAPVERDAPAELARAGVPSSLHLPVITRCAASATASAMIDPSLVALAIMLFAAADAVSAASSPASRIARRAFGLALIAAAAAASPAASISLLMAALASLSTVLLAELDDEPDDREEVFLVDLAIAYSPSVRCRKDTWRT